MREKLLPVVPIHLVRSLGFKNIFVPLKLCPIETKLRRLEYFSTAASYANIFPFVRSNFRENPTFITFLRPHSSHLIAFINLSLSLSLSSCITLSLFSNKLGTSWPTNAKIKRVSKTYKLPSAFRNFLFELYLRDHSRENHIFTLQSFQKTLARKKNSSRRVDPKKSRLLGHEEPSLQNEAHLRQNALE